MGNVQSMVFEKNIRRFSGEYTYSNKVIRYFPDTDLRCGHTGLALLAKGSGVNAENLKPGEFLVFVNSKKSALKMYSPGNILAHLKLPGGEKITPSLIAMMPKFFGGQEIDYRGSVKALVKQDLGKFSA